MGILARQKRGPTGRTGGSRAKRIPENHPLLGEPLKIRRFNGISIRLNNPSGVMGMKIENVGHDSLEPFRVLLLNDIGNAGRTFMN